MKHQKIAYLLLPILLFSVQATSEVEALLSSILSKKDVIDGVNEIVDKLQAQYDAKQLALKFQSFGNEISDARVVFFGEHHGDENGLDEVSALQFLLAPSDIILREGGQAGEMSYCGTMVLDLVTYNICRALDKLVKIQTGKNIGYSPKLYSMVEKWLEPIVLESLDELRLNKLKLSNSECSYWDNPELGSVFENNEDIVWIDDEERVLFENRGETDWSEPLTRRNMVMVSEIRKHIKNGRRVFIKAGLSHLPSGDLNRFRLHFKSQPQKMASLFGLTEAEVENLSLSEYYDVLGRAMSDRARFYIEHEGMGSTKVIYDFLKSENLKYVELVPKAIIDPSFYA